MESGGLVRMKLLKFLFWLLPKRHRTIGKQKYKFNITESDEDIRDTKFVQNEFYKTLFPETIDYSEFVPAIKDQGSIGSCGSHAAVTGIETLEKIYNPSWYVPLSEMFHYWIVRQEEYEGLVFNTTYPNDNGQTGRDAMRVLNRVGVCPENLYPYNVSNFNDMPFLAPSFARFWKLLEYNKCWSVDAIKSALVDKKVVWLGIPVKSNFLKHKGEDVITFDPDFQHKGGHAVLIVGYNESKQAFRIVNSWGTTWGDKGYGWMSYQYLYDADWFDSWAMRQQR